MPSFIEYSSASIAKNKTKAIVSSLISVDRTYLIWSDFFYFSELLYCFLLLYAFIIYCILLLSASRILLVVEDTVRYTLFYKYTVLDLTGNDFLNPTLTVIY